MVQPRANVHEGVAERPVTPPSPTGWGSAVRELLSGRHENVVYGIFVCFVLWVAKDFVVYFVEQNDVSED